MNEVPAAKRGIAMVFQSYALYPHMTLYDNMAFGLKIAGKSKQEIDQAVQHAARILHIDHLLDRKPRALSGGQRQRVAIGRAITRQPSVFLFDEPLSNLDAALRVKMRLEFSKLHDEFKTTMIYVIHDQIEAMTLADKIVVLSAGRIEQVGSPKMNFIDAKVVGTSASGALLELTGGGVQLAAVDASSLQLGEQVTLGVRPEHLRIVDTNTTPTLQARFTALELLGDFSYLYASSEAAEEALILRVSDSLQLASGSIIGITADPERRHLFRSDGSALPRQITTLPVAA